MMEQRGMVAAPLVPALRKALLVALVLLASMGGCTSPNGALPLGGGGGGGGGGQPPPATCGASPATGCPCSPDGQIIACGQVEGHNGPYTFCSEGSRKCSAGVWSACEGEVVVAKNFGGAWGYMTESINPASPLECATSSCTPLTCGSSVCGEIDNGCGTLLQCGPMMGACSAGQYCSAGQCLPTNCTPTTGPAQMAACTAAGITCGVMSDACGDDWVCGMCPVGKACVGGTCVAAPMCTPKTCATILPGGMPATCGHYDNGCGADLNCDMPGCTLPEVCNNGACSLGICTPLTPVACLTADLGLPQVCGLLSSTCDTDFSCGSCPDMGQECIGGHCSPNCAPATSCPPGVICGTRSDGCGGTISCGTCPTGTCSNYGTECLGAASCTPMYATAAAACTAAGAQCGYVSDGCSASYSCGSCSDPTQSCVLNQCVGGCVPTTCGAQGIQCGYIDDGCGNQLNCDLPVAMGGGGGCMMPQTCGGGATAGQCGGTTPTSCTPTGMMAQCSTASNQCGFVSDGCDSSYNCGGCAMGSCIGGIGLPATPPMMMGSMGGATACTNNPCDPYCMNYVETPMGLSLPPGLTDTMGGMSPMCEEPANLATSFGMIYSNLSGGEQVNPTPCASGMSDNCDFDSECLAAMCAPYAPGATNPGCPSSPDFTVGIGCCNGMCADMSGDWEMEVCNRGGAAATTGTLYVGINTGSPAAASCAGANGPAIPMSGTDKGYCAIDLATQPLMAGECISLDMLTACVAGAGGSFGNMSGDHWVMVNPPSSVLNYPAGITQLPECDTCNNFAAYHNTAATLPAFQCAASSCGTTSGGSGGITISSTGGGSACMGLSVTPATSTVTVTAIDPTFTTSPASVTFTAMCMSGMAMPTWSLSNASGTADTIGAISPMGVVTIYNAISGPLTVTATNGSLTATATVNVQVNVNDTNGASAALVSDFAGTASGTDPAIPLYPYAQTMFPVYLPAPLVQWDIGCPSGCGAATGVVATGVRMALDYTAGNFHWSQIETGEPENGVTSQSAGNVPGPYVHAPAFQIPQDVWSDFELSASSTTPISPAGPYSGAQISFQRYVGATLYPPVVIPVNFSEPVPLDGTVYYVEYQRNVTNAHANDGAVTNVSFPYSIANVCPVGNGTHVETGTGSGTRSLSVVGAAAPPADPFNGTATCPVCHSISATGKTYVGVNQYIGLNYGGTATVGVNSIGAGGAFTAITQALPNVSSWVPRGFSYGAVTPDGQFVLQGTEFWGNTATVGPSANATSAPDTPNNAYIGYNITANPAVTITLSGLPTGTAGPREMMTPTFSPDGTKLIYVNGDTGLGGATGWRKGISMMSVVETSSTVMTFSAEALLFNTWNAGGTGAVLKWPFFESDSRSVIFQESSANSYCSNADVSNATNVPCYENPYGGMEPTSRGAFPGTLYSLDSGGTLPATPIELTRLNTALATNYPSATCDTGQSYQATVLSNPAAGYRWVIFTSPRAYGNQLNNANVRTNACTDPSCATGQIWMAAIQDATSAGSDRSFPAFRLSGQNYAPIVAGAGSNQYVNERGYLVPSACKVSGMGSGSACNVDSDCCSNSCRIDLPATAPPTSHCQPAPMGCAATGASCSMTSDCCGTDLCVMGACFAQPSYATATMTQQFTANCPMGTEAVWQNFQWNASAPMPPLMVTSANIVFSATAAPTVAQLATAPTVMLATANFANSNPPVGMPIANYEYANVENTFEAGGYIEKDMNVLQITMTFNPSSDNLQAPILYDWDQAFDCIPSE